MDLQTITLILVALASLAIIINFIEGKIKFILAIIIILFGLKMFGIF